MASTSGSGIFTQSGGINIPYASHRHFGTDCTTFSSLQLGYSNGGYGEYDMSGGSLGVNAIYVGGNTDAQLFGTVLLKLARECSRKPADPSAPSAAPGGRTVPLV